MGELVSFILKVVCTFSTGKGRYHAKHSHTVWETACLVYISKLRVRELSDAIQLRLFNKVQILIHLAPRILKIRLEITVLTECLLLVIVLRFGH